MGIRIGDKFEIEEKDGEIVLKPVMVIPKEQNSGDIYLFYYLS
jgi:hypothetical protein